MQRETTIELPILVLNLDRDGERLEHMRTQMEALGLTFRRFPATDKLLLTKEEKDLYSRRQALIHCTRELSDGEVACAISHARIWQEIVNRGDELTLVLEDDVVFEPAFKEVLARLKFMHEEYDLINFTTTSKHIPTPKILNEVHVLAEFEDSPNMASAYLITLEAAKKLLAKAFPIRMPADALTGRTYLTGIRAFGVCPQVASRAGFESSIWTGDVVPRKKRFFKKLKKVISLFKKI